MMKWLSSLAALLLIPSSAFSAAFTLSPESQTTKAGCTITVGAADLAGVKGMDIVIEWDRGVLSCSGAQVVPGALPGFAVFLERVDNHAGSLEIVILKQSAGGYTGSPGPFLALTFDAVATGTSRVIVKKSSPQLDPLLVNEAGGAIDAAADTARVVVEGTEPPPIITVTKLHQNYPNPFNPSTSIRFDVPSPSAVTLCVYDVSGRLVRSLLDREAYTRGSWVKDWDGRNNSGVLVPSGVYVCRLEASGQRSSMKLVVLR